MKRDAPDIARAFQALGLKTELVQDAGRDTMQKAVDKFAAASRGAELAAFYFAGHGVAWEKDTYLVPADADLTTPSTIPSLLSVSTVRDAVKEASHRLLVFDNCRNNPADGWRQRAASYSSQVAAADRSVAGLNAPNTLILFSTAPGRVALDGPPGENSPFAAAFLKQLSAASVDLTSLPAGLRRDLLISTRGRQVLWDQSSYTAPFVLAGVRGRATVGENAVAGVLELPKAYDFARENKMLLPPGLVAFRTPEGSPHSPKIGSFHCTTKLRVSSAITSNYPGYSFDPLLLIVIAVPDNGTAEIVMSTKDWAQAGGSHWRYLSASLSGSSLKYYQGYTSGHNASATLLSWNQSPATSDEFVWKDADSGRGGCRVTSTRGGVDSSGVWFAPTAQANDRNFQAWTTQVKPLALWPLTVGKTMRAAYEGEGQTPGYRSKWDMLFTVEKFEKVTTKAGTFDAFVVSYKSDQHPPSTWRSLLRTWYAPGPGVTVKWEYSDNQNQSGSKSSGEALAIGQ